MTQRKRTRASIREKRQLKDGISMSKKQTNYVLLLDYSGGTLIKIKLTEEEKNEAKKFEDFEDFLQTLEDKYEFHLRDCEWISVDKIKERKYGI